MKTKTLALLAFLILASFGAKSQEFIYKKNREIIKVKIIEIGTDEIKFKEYDNPDGPIFTIEKEKVSKIEMENGDILEIKTTDAFNDPDYYTDDHKNIIKVNFTGVMFNYLAFSYERSLTPTSSFEAGFGIIGAGLTMSESSRENIGEYNFRNPLGVNFRGGYKLKRSPSYYIPKMRYGHILKGAYIKPEFIISIFTEDVNTYDHITGGYNTDRKNAVAGAFMINFGQQWIFSNKFSLDWYIGIGYGFSNSDNYKFDNDNYRDSPAGLHYGFLLIPSLPIAFTSGLTFGYVFGN